MENLQRVWTPDNSSESKSYPDTLYIYDAGDFIGYLTVKNQRKQWSGFTLVSRVKKDTLVEETLQAAHEFQVPMTFFSIESYPAKIDSSTLLWIPGWKIQLLPKKQKPLRESEVQPQQDSRPQPPLPSKQHKNQVQHQPSLQPGRSHSSPSFQPPRRSPSGKQAPSQHFSQNKNNISSRPKASPSSNQVFHVMPKQSIQEKSEVPPSPSFPTDHSAPLSQWYPLSQVSLSPQPPSSPGGSNPRPTSSSQNRSSSRSHLPSRQAQRPRGGKSQNPTFSPPSSHE